MGVHAQEGDTGKIAPLPFAEVGEAAPSNEPKPPSDQDILTTRDMPTVKKTEPGAYQPKIPFGRADYSTKPVPEGPHKTVAVPIDGVDEVETSEPEPAAPLEDGADPAKEAPEEPTELTSPLFVMESGSIGPRKVVLRALNKVTAQSETLNLKPGEMVRFGKLEITAVTCQTSAPNSLTDYAGLLDIREQPLTAAAKAKPLFRGWMYASSPSLVALEHPVYDITMVRCETMPTGGKKTEKADEIANEKKPAPKAQPKTETPPEEVITDD